MLRAETLFYSMQAWPQRSLLEMPIKSKLDQGTLGMSDPSQVNLHQGHQGHQAIRTTRATRATRVIRATKNNEKLIKTMENDEKQ